MSKRIWAEAEADEFNVGIKTYDTSSGEFIINYHASAFAEMMSRKIDGDIIHKYRVIAPTSEKIYVFAVDDHTDQDIIECAKKLYDKRYNKLHLKSALKL